MLSKLSSSLSRNASRQHLRRYLVISPASTQLFERTTICLPTIANGHVAWFSDESHDDFKPKLKGEPQINDENTEKLIDKQIKGHPVMLYMKGNPQQPMCGFSARVVEILSLHGVDYASVNVLDYPVIREAVKRYSNWPTIPQLYVNGEFIGGCDIVTSMHESGELEELLMPYAGEDDEEEEEYDEYGEKKKKKK